MSAVFMLSIGLVVAAGVLLVLSRYLFRVIVGLAVLGSAANLIVFLSGRPGSLTPPIIEAAAARLPPHAADPLPQALVLTAIVISFALLCFTLILGARLTGRPGRDDVDRMRTTEPPATQRDKPAELKR